MLLSPAALAADLAVRDLTDPAQGPHAIQLVVDEVVGALADAWHCRVEVVRTHPVTSTEDNYDRLGYPPDAVARDARYSRYVSETCLLRTHTSAVIPYALRATAGGDVLLACPGVVYRRDSIDRLHTGTPHQLDLWRVTSAPKRREDLLEMVGLVVAAALPGAEHRVLPAVHPYTVDGHEIEVRAGDRWIEIGECGLASPAVTHGLAMGLGLDRLVMLRKGMDDIRLLRSTDPRVAAQMTDLSPYRPVSAMPAIVRDISIAVADPDPELLGDGVRTALGARADAVEAVDVLAATPWSDVPPIAAARLGLRDGQTNVLLRIVLRDLDRTLTNDEANTIRDQLYAALHEGAA
jgi:phenylalanyl-tRNA synthetase alpha chain